MHRVDIIYVDIYRYIYIYKYIHNHTHTNIAIVAIIAIIIMITTIMAWLANFELGLMGTQCRHPKDSGT